MAASYQLVTGPAQEPISLDEAKRQARVRHDESNDLLRKYIVTSREAAEQCLGYGLFTQTWRLALDGFYDEMLLPMALRLQVGDSAPVVTYYDADGALQTLSASVYLVDTVHRPARLTRAPGMSWPSTQSDRMTGCVFVQYVVGWSDVNQIPERIKQGIRSYVTFLDLDRDGTNPDAERAKAAAEACWIDTLEWVPPEERCARCA